MPGCRKLETAPNAAIRGERVALARYVRVRARPPRAANDNRRLAAPNLWHWALLVGVAPTIGIVAALSVLL
ncbi:hypothetical protein [Methylobacterium symbioticum]|jgi:hypothetical protein|uniref:Uncharacterized protein n=1 Tax=Methylobacterium symbioticum TaxID=2584084 RepID=A0A509EDG9_9HYPH|nr:hypothetical protein [Methylobacterium symbioticum]VUD72327.1 hypothetical protein MET9862_02922 [Methylobacterium symbioticum]